MCKIWFSFYFLEQQTIHFEKTIKFSFIFPKKSSTFFSFKFPEKFYPLEIPLKNYQKIKIYRRIAIHGVSEKFGPIENKLHIYSLIREEWNAKQPLLIIVCKHLKVRILDKIKIKLI